MQLNREESAEQSGSEVAAGMQGGMVATLDEPRAAYRTRTGSYMTGTDEDLLRQCGNGDQNALEELVRRYQRPMLRFLMRMMDSTADAEEAAAEVFIRVWRNAARFEFRSRVATWLYRIAVNIARDAHARNRSRSQDVSLDSSPAINVATASAEDEAVGNIERADNAIALQRALGRMRGDDRLVLVLYYIEEKEYEEIQAVTGLTYTVLKTRLARARQRLRELMVQEQKGLNQ